MSRSYKKTPVVKDNRRSKKWKKALANRTVRRKLNDPEYGMADGRAYKKEYESWNIADYVIRWTKEEAIAEYNAANNFIDKDRFPTLESWIEWWEKCMKRK